MFERKEYPRPQFRRENWQSLNSEWEFAFDDKNEGIKSGLWQGNKALPLKIKGGDGSPVRAVALLDE